ncbi:MAG: glycosyltransferase [Bacteroidetes bacterium]|nr:glycosyltransferase [Bacteroidota bacterium]
MPDISVILPVYNGMPYLKESVSSVLSQQNADFELLILDDCSTDESVKYLQTINDSRVKLYKNDTNKKLFYNLNYLSRKSNSPLIKLWSQDDVMLPDALSEIVAFHKAHPEVGFSYTARNYIDETGSVIATAKYDPTPEIIDAETHAKICFYTGSIAGNIANVTIVKEALEKVGYFNEQMIISGDFDMWVRIAEFYKIGFMNKPLINLRNHSGQLSRQTKYYIRHIEEDISVFKYLFSYIPGQLKEYGQKELRKHKLMFYTTLMMHSLVKGRVSDFANYWKTISKIDNPALLMGYLIRQKFISKKN